MQLTAPAPAMQQKLVLQRTNDVHSRLNYQYGVRAFISSQSFLPILPRLLPSQCVGRDVVCFGAMLMLAKGRLIQLELRPVLSFRPGGVFTIAITIYNNRSVKPRPIELLPLLPGCSAILYSAIGHN
jgi:hypothetical protein